MGGSSKQVTGYKYFANFLLFIGNPIERLIAINFDKRGWLNPLVDESGNALAVGTINKPSLYGENEGGVAGQIHARYGTANPEPVSFYANYLADNDLPSLAYPYQSYLAFTGLSYVESSNPLELLSGNYGGGFYLGNSGYMKEMLLWPKRIHVKNDGSPQWYDGKAEIFQYEYDGEVVVGGFDRFYLNLNGVDYPSDGQSSSTITDSGGIAKIWIEYSSSENMLLNVRSILWPVGTTSVTIVHNAISGSLEIIETQPWAEAVAGILMFEKGINKIAEITITYATPNSSGRIDWLINNPVVTTNKIIKDPDKTDINPIHKIREILTDDTAMNKPESDVNDSNFMKAADRIWDEGLGISWAITEKSCMDAINELCSHIEAGIRVNRQTGLYEMVLFRDDWFEETEIHSLAENKIKSMQIDPINVEDVKNYLNVSHYDRENIKDASFSIANNASIKNMNGFVNAETADFPYFMNQRNAAVVAQWKLKQFTTPCWKGTFTTGYNEARKWNRYDIVKINWARKNIVDLPVRIMSINLGDGIDNTVSIDFVEVVPFSDELTSTVVIDDKIDTAPLPPQPAVFKTFELPYFEAVQSQGQKAVDDELAYNPDIGYVAVVAKRPQNNSLNAQMHTDAGTGYENSAVIQYCETAKLDQEIDRVSSSFIIKNVGDIESVRVGSQIFMNDETMVYQSFDATTKVLTVKRGALDTLPQAHAADSILFFADDFVAADQDQYMDGEIIGVKAVTTTPSGVLDLDVVDAQSVEIRSRAIRPYPPANVKFNDTYYPQTLYVTNDIVLTWVDRNRVQQTGGAILGFYDAGVTLEVGVTYSYELSSEGVVLDSGLNITANTITIPSSVLIQNYPHSLKLWAVRDDFASYQIFEHAFFVESASLILTATATESEISGNTVPVANITVNVDESLQANLKYDGSSISGKAEAGATITIEIEE